jgi:outer membrane protein insertion porin family
VGRLVGGLLGLGACLGPAAGRAEVLPRHLPVIEAIEFTGSDLHKGDKLFFSDKELLEQMLLRMPSWLHPLRPTPQYQRNVFPKELRRLENYYRRHGFGGVHARLDSVIVLPGGDASDPDEVRLRIHIREGPRTILREVRYSPQDVFSLEELRRATPIAEKDAYPFGGPQRGRVTRALRLAYATLGYLQVSVTDSTIVAADSTEAVLILNLAPGPQFHIANVHITGQDDTRQELIERELRFKAGDVYSYARLVESQENLYTTTLFRSVVIEETNIDVQAKSVDLVVRVIERKNGYVEGSVGFGRRDEYEARVVGRWGHRNIGGWGHSAELSSTLAYNIEKAGSNFLIDERLRYVHRHIFGPSTRLVPEVAYSVDRRIEDVTLQRTSADMQLFWKGGRYTTNSLGIFTGFTITTLEEEESVDDFLETQAVGASVSRNSADNPFDPRRGDFRAVSVAHSGFWGDNHLNRVTGTYARYVPYKNWVLAFEVRAGWVEAFGPSREGEAADIGIQGVPFEFLFQAGGNTTVRGFDNNSLGSPITVTSFGDGSSGAAVVDTVAVHAGTVLLLGNLELRARIPLPPLRKTKLQWVFFMDAGNVWFDIHKLLSARFGPRYSEDYTALSDMRYSYGFGLRYPTPVGPIRADLGFPLKDFGKGKFHLGLGHTF